MNLGVLMHWFPSESSTQIEVSLFISPFLMASYQMIFSQTTRVLQKPYLSWLLKINYILNLHRIITLPFIIGCNVIKNKLHFELASNHHFTIHHWLQCFLGGVMIPNQIKLFWGSTLLVQYDIFSITDHITNLKG